MFTVRKKDDRGSVRFEWLDSRHTFSFGHYHDPRYMGFGPLRVINEDRVAPAAGFDTHPHANMEIVSYVLEGVLAHTDSMGNGSIIRPGEIQRMSAGTGVTHSESNPSSTDPVHFYQIWFLPAVQNIAPSYAQALIPPAAKQGCFAHVLSPDGRQGSLTINQDVHMHIGVFDGADSSSYHVAPDRILWAQLARGSISINGLALSAGDGVAIRDEPYLVFDGAKGAEIIVMDMALPPS